MNLDQEDKVSTTGTKESGKKKLNRKEKKALKKAEKAKQNQSAVPKETKTKPTPKPSSSSQPADPKKNTDPKSEEVEAKLDPAPVEEIPPPTYTAWEKISPPARRKKQISNMESGFREVLGLVQSMRNNQEVLLDAFQKLPEAVDSVKKLADHSAQQSDLLKAMNDSMHTGAAGDFNKTLTSMDQTTQLLLERAQRSEERLYSMLRRAQRRIAFMTLLVLLLFLGAAAAGMAIFFPEKAEAFLDKFQKEEIVETEVVEELQESAGEDIRTAEPEEIPAESPELPESTSESPIDQPMEDTLPLNSFKEIQATATETMIMVPDSAEDLKEDNEQADSVDKDSTEVEEESAEQTEAVETEETGETEVPEDL